MVAIMKLSTYLNSKEITQREFAVACKISPSVLCRILKGQRVPSPVIAKKIVKATGRLVTLEDIYA